MTYENFARKLVYISITVSFIIFIFSEIGSILEGKDMYATIYDEEPAPSYFFEYLFCLVTSIFYAQYVKNLYIRGLVIAVFGLLMPFLFFNMSFKLPEIFDYILIFILIFTTLLLIKVRLKKE